MKSSRLGSERKPASIAEVRRRVKDLFFQRGWFSMFLLFWLLPYGALRARDFTENREKLDGEVTKLEDETIEESLAELSDVNMYHLESFSEGIVFFPEKLLPLGNEAGRREFGGHHK